MKLSELLKGVECIEPDMNFVDMEISSIAYHSGKVEDDGLFVCIKGYKTDGHKYLKDAVNRGAVAALVEEFQPKVPVLQIRVKDARKALAMASCNFYSHPSRKMTMIGITATNGKTTTSFMLNEILKKNGYKTGLIGTVMIASGDKSIPSDLTTPESLDLQGYLSEMYLDGVTHVVMEVSSSALDLSRVHGVDFDYVCFNNISREHIDLHGSFEEYLRIKSSLILEAKKEAVAVLNGEEEVLLNLKEKSCCRVLTYGVQHPVGDIYCKDVDISDGRANWLLSLEHLKDESYLQKEFRIKLSVPGFHSVYNAMSAIAVSLSMGIDIDVIRNGLLSFKGVERRFQFIYEDGFTVVDDHYANAGNIDVTLSTLSKMKYRNLHLVYGIRGSRGVIVNSENANATLKWLDQLRLKTFVATKSISHVTEKDRVTDEETEAFLSVMKKGGLDILIRDELPDAIDIALSRVEDGDVILLAGCQVMDSGGRVVLEKLAEGKSEGERRKILEPVKDRVCGI